MLRREREEILVCGVKAGGRMEWRIPKTSELETIGNSYSSGYTLKAKLAILQCQNSERNLDEEKFSVQNKGECSSSRIFKLVVA